MAHYFGLVGNAVDVDTFGQFSFEFIQHFVHLFPEGDDIGAGLHLHREQHTLVSVVSDVAICPGILTHYASNVFHTHHIALWRGVNYLVGNFLFGSECFGYVNGHFRLFVFEHSVHGGEALKKHIGSEGFAADAISRQFLIVEIQTYLLLLRAIAPHISHIAHSAKPVFEPVAISVNLPKGFIVGLHGNQHRRNVAKIIIDHHRQHSRRQTRFEARNSMLNFRPYDIMVFHLIGKVDENITNAIFASRHTRFPIHFGIGEQITFEWLGELLLHLLGACTGIYTYYQTFPDGIFGHFLLGHFDE